MFHVVQVGRLPVLLSTTTMLNAVDRAPGNVIDWMYAKAGIKYSYAVHLRDTGTVRLMSLACPDWTTQWVPSLQYGFVLPPEWIRPVGEETANMVQFLAEFILLTKCEWATHT